MNSAGKWACDRLTEDADFGKKIIFSDKAHFDLGLWSRGTIGPLSMSKERLLHSMAIVIMLNEFLFTRIEEEDIGNIWFQQDRATCHTAEAILDVFRLVFEDHIISRRADVVWPLRSYELIPLDYYLWGAVKDKCYTNKPETIVALKDNIREAIGEIQLHTIDNVLKIRPLM